MTYIDSTNAKQVAYELMRTLPKYLCTGCGEEIFGGELAVTKEDKWKAREDELERICKERGIARMEDTFGLQVQCEDSYHHQCCPSRTHREVGRAQK